MVSLASPESIGAYQVPQTQRDLEAQEIVPITEIIQGFAPNPDRVRFCYLILQNTVDALLTHRYTDFDAQTTTNCCHGIALLARELINSANRHNLLELRQEAEKNLSTQIDPHWRLPKKIAELAQLYILTCIRETDPKKGTRSTGKKLQSIYSQLTNNFYRKLVNGLQKQYANTVAFRYRDYFNSLPQEMRITKLPVGVWGKYVSKKHLRVDFRDMHYAPCLYSMQISLAQLIFSRAKIAIVNDIYSETGTLKERQIKILEGDGKEAFRVLDVEEFHLLRQASEEPLVVFGGNSITSDPDRVMSQIDDWAHRFTHLVLACDLHYPQFPEVRNDPTFSSDPIIPEEEALHELFTQHRTIEGVSAKNPSLFCLNHIYPSSLGQVLKSFSRKNYDSLPQTTIPEIFRKS